jgi:hypothetical protein
VKAYAAGKNGITSCADYAHVESVSGALDAVSPVAPKCMDRSGPGENFTTVRYAVRNEVFFAGPYWNSLAIDDQWYSSPAQRSCIRRNRERVPPMLQFHGKSKMPSGSRLLRRIRNPRRPQSLDWTSRSCLPDVS